MERDKAVLTDSISCIGSELTAALATIASAMVLKSRTGNCSANKPLSTFNNTLIDTVSGTKVSTSLGE